MKLSQDTLDILKNFAQINGNLVVNAGSNLRTISVSRTMMAEAVVTESFPVSFGIYNLTELLGVIKMLGDTDADIDFGATEMTIRSKNGRVRYVYTDPTLLVHNTKNINMPKEDFSFVMEQDALDRCLRAQSTIGVGDLEFSGEAGKNLNIHVFDRANPSSHRFTVALDDPVQSNFSALIKLGNLKVMPSTYHISLSSKRLSKWVSTSRQLTYYVALEAESTF